MERSGMPVAKEMEVDSAWKIASSNMNEALDRLNVCVDHMGTKLMQVLAQNASPAAPPEVPVNPGSSDLITTVTAWTSRILVYADQLDRLRRNVEL